MTAWDWGRWRPTLVTGLEDKAHLEIPASRSIMKITYDTVTNSISCPDPPPEQTTLLPGQP